MGVQEHWVGKNGSNCGAKEAAPRAWGCSPERRGMTPPIPVWLGTQKKGEEKRVLHPHSSFLYSLRACAYFFFFFFDSFSSASASSGGGSSSISVVTITFS